jgi:hypothetical protein
LEFFSSSIFTYLFTIERTWKVDTERIKDEAWSISWKFWRIMWTFYLWNIISLPSLTTISPLNFQQVSIKAVAIHLFYCLPLEVWLWANKRKRQIFTQHLHFRS